MQLLEAKADFAHCRHPYVLEIRVDCLDFIRGAFRWLAFSLKLLCIESRLWAELINIYLQLLDVHAMQVLAKGCGELWYG